jgi:hypothetical protein
MRSEAELRIAFMALRPLSYAFGLSEEEQMVALATTVWPMVLGLNPGSGETSEEYIRRVCRGDESLDCSGLSTGAQTRLLNAQVVRVFQMRANSAYAMCDECQKDPSYRQALDEFNVLVQMTRELALQPDRRDEGSAPAQATDQRNTN